MTMRAFPALMTMRAFPALMTMRAFREGPTSGMDAE